MRLSLVSAVVQTLSVCSWISLQQESVRLIGVEPAGSMILTNTARRLNTVKRVSSSVVKTRWMNGQAEESYSVSAGLDFLLVLNTRI